MLNYTKFLPFEKFKFLNFTGNSLPILFNTANLLLVVTFITVDHI